MNAPILELIRRKHDAGEITGQPPPRVEVYTCPICKDMKWVIDPDKPIGPGRSGNAVPCICNQPTGKQQEEDALVALQPNAPAIRLADLTRTPYNAHAIAAIQDLISARNGMLTLTGLPGRGKSTLLHALVTELRLLNIAAACTTTAALLNHLREGFNQPGEYDRRWRDICNLPVLAIDDLDRFKRTEWSVGRLTALIDLRSQARSRTITSVALDTQVGQLLSQTTLPERIVRRLTQPDALVVTVYAGVEQEGGFEGQSRHV